MDFPTAWQLLKTTALLEHHPDCSYRQMSRGVLCDCDVIRRLEADKRIDDLERQLGVWEAGETFIEVMTLRDRIKELEDVLEELVDIIDDEDARMEIDSITTQPARKVLREK